MALINLNIYSYVLGMYTTVEVIIPQNNPNAEAVAESNVAETKYKCLYLLHGLGDNQTIWTRKTSIERYAIEHGIAVVMPDGYQSFYADTKYGMKYYTYIAKELPSIIENMFNISSKREDRYIGGLSMGGYGALKIALNEEERYGAVFSLYPVADIHRQGFAEIISKIFGDTIPECADLFNLATAHNSDVIKPRIYLTVGKSDFMYEDTARLNKHFLSLNYDYTYIETDGGHTWALADKMVQDAIDWMLKNKTNH